MAHFAVYLAERFLIYFHRRKPKRYLRRIFISSTFLLRINRLGITYSSVSHIPLIIAVSSLGIFLCSFIFSKDRERTMFTNVNLMTTMLLGGLWHGASLRFIIWGALHGLALAVHKIFLEIFLQKIEKRMHLITFGDFSLFCWRFILSFSAGCFSVQKTLIRHCRSSTISANWPLIQNNGRSLFQDIKTYSC